MAGLSKAAAMASALRGQSGRIDPRLMLGTGTVAGGAAVGSYAKDQLEQARHEAAERKRKAEEQANK